MNVDEENIDNLPEITTHSHYFDDDLIDVLKTKKNCFTIFSSNIQSMNAKFSELEAFIYELK